MPIILKGKSGKEYLFDIYDDAFVPHIENCVYIYAKKVNSIVTPIYIGITCRDFNTRYKEHENDSVNHCTGFEESNCFLFHTSSDAHHPFTEDTLRAIEGDLLAKYCPPCNDKIPS